MKERPSVGFGSKVSGYRALQAIGGEKAPRGSFPTILTRSLRHHFFAKFNHLRINYGVFEGVESIGEVAPDAEDTHLRELNESAKGTPDLEDPAKGTPDLEDHYETGLISSIYRQPRQQRSGLEYIAGFTTWMYGNRAVN